MTIWVTFYSLVTVRSIKRNKRRREKERMDEVSVWGEAKMKNN